MVPSSNTQGVSLQESRPAPNKYDKGKHKCGEISIIFIFKQRIFFEKRKFNLKIN